MGGCLLLGDGGTGAMASRRVDQDDVRRAVVSALEEYHKKYCQDCSQEGKIRHREHHAALDDLLELLHRWTNAKWKIGIGISIMVMGALTMVVVTWILLHTIGLDIRRWLG